MAIMIECCLLMFALLVAPSSAFAYIGPGMAVGAIGVVIGFVFAIFLALISILWYPFKRLLRRMNKKAQPDDSRSDCENS